MAVKKHIDKIQNALKEDDQAGVLEACKAFIFELPKHDVPIDPKLATRVLKSLRDDRYFRLLRSLAQAIINDGCNDIDVIKLYAQGLIDTGELDPAAAILEQYLEAADLEDAQFADAFGVLGRAWKDKAVKTCGIRHDLCNLATQRAYAAYEKPYRHNTARFYQGINLVAIAHWDKGRALSDDQLKFATEAAMNISNQLSARTIEELPAWDIATAGESALAAGNFTAAGRYFGHYVDHNDVNVFQLAGTVRQLTELWKLDDTEPGRELLAPLRARLLERPGGSFSVSPQAIRDMEKVPKVSYEKVLGKIGAMTHRSLMTGLAKARSVAMIKDRGNGRTFGTGFVVDGSDFHKSLKDNKLILTNYHNVSSPVWSHPSDPRKRSKLPEDVAVRFELLAENSDHEWEIQDIVWQSPPDQHDATLLRLKEPLPDSIGSIDVSRNLPSLDDRETSMVFIIGHPGGNQISFSFNDNELIDYEKSAIDKTNDPSPVKIHYRAPTSEGSSGSPVFDYQWRGIGIHHSGGRSMKKLNGKPGFYSANEGIWLESIHRAMNKDSRLNN